jgi:Flp pilus assembly protein TadG
MPDHAVLAFGIWNKFMTRHQGLKNRFLHLVRAQRGASLPMIAAGIIPMIGALGGAVDLANVYMVRSQLRDSVDSAALTGGRLYNADDRDTQVNNYITANLSALRTGNTLESVTIAQGPAGSGATLTVTAKVKVKTFLMRVFGIETVETQASATVERRSNALELVLALDNTLSMDQLDADGNVRINSLKSASRDFVGILYGGADTNPNLQISVLPYTAYVNIGKMLQDEQATTGKTYINPIPGYVYNPADPLGWKGCVDEPDTDNTITSATDAADNSKWTTAYDTQEYIPGSAGKPLFTPTRVPSWRDEWMATPNNGVSCPGPQTYYRDGEKFTTKPDPMCVPKPPTVVGPPTPANGGHQYAVPAGWTSDVWRRTTVGPNDWKLPNSTWPAAVTYPGSGYGPNTYCPSATLPLKQYTKTELDTYLANEMKVAGGGYAEGTMTNSAMAWAYRILTPALPFAAPVKTSAREKVIVLMTDGFLAKTSNVDVRSGYGYPEQEKLLQNSAALALSASNGNPTAQADYDSKARSAMQGRMSRLCVMAKREGIKVYTITFMVPASDPRSQIYKDCATDPSMYYSPDTADTLNAAFTAIGTELSSIRLTK